MDIVSVNASFLGGLKSGDTIGYVGVSGNTAYNPNTQHSELGNHRRFRFSQQLPNAKTEMNQVAMSVILG